MRTKNLMQRLSYVFIALILFFSCDKDEIIPTNGTTSAKNKALVLEKQNLLTKQGMDGTQRDFYRFGVRNENPIITEQELNKIQERNEIDFKR